MAGVLALLFMAVFASQAVGTVVYLFLMGRLLSRLEREHPALHKDLGSPSLIFNNSFRNNKLVLTWLWHKDYLALEDHVTRQRAAVVRQLFVTLIVSFAVMLLLFFTFGMTYRSAA